MTRLPTCSVSWKRCFAFGKDLSWFHAFRWTRCWRHSTRRTLTIWVSMLMAPSCRWQWPCRQKRFHGRPKATPATQNASRKSSGRDKNKEATEAKFSWCLSLKCSKTHLQASLIPNFSREGYRRTFVKMGKGGGNEMERRREGGCVMAVRGMDAPGRF